MSDVPARENASNDLRIQEGAWLRPVVEPRASGPPPGMPPKPAAAAQAQRPKGQHE